MAGLKVYSTEGDIKVYGIEGAFYKINRVIIERKEGGIVLRNTWTGEEKSISLKEAKQLLKAFQYK